MESKMSGFNSKEEADKIDKAMVEHALQERAREEKLFFEIMKEKGWRFLWKVFIEIDESCANSIIGFVDKPHGTKDVRDKDSLEIWVNQTTDGGYSGDSYAGTCDIKISEGKYLRFSYSM